MGDILRSIGIMPQKPEMPGTISGINGGTWNSDGTQATPVRPTQTPVEAALAPPPEAALADEPQEVMVDGWRPKKPTLLGVLADTLLLSRGRPAMFGALHQQYNMKNALQPFQNDPEQAIARVRQLNPELAWRMQQQHVDNERQQAQADAQTRYNNFRYDDVVQDRIARMVGALTPENYGTLLPRIKTYAQAKGATVDLPDTYDADALSLYRMGGVSVDDQMDNYRDGYYKNRRLGQMDERLRQQGASTESLINHRNENRAEQARHNSVTEAQGERRLQKGEKSRTLSNGSKIVRNSVGHEVEISPDGKKARIKIGGEYRIYELDKPNDITSGRRIK